MVNSGSFVSRSYNCRSEQSANLDLVSDATILIRSIAGDAAAKAATKINPTDEQLAQIDEPAADNTWHDAPDFSKENLKNQLKSRVPIGKGGAQQAAGDMTQATHPDGSRDPADLANATATEQQMGREAGIDVTDGAQMLKDAAKDNVPEDTKNKTREYRERTTKYLQGKMPKERREQTIWRLKKMVVEIQGHPDCKCWLAYGLYYYILTDYSCRSTSCRNSLASGKGIWRSRSHRRYPERRRCERCPY